MTQPLWMWSLPSLPHHEDVTRCDHQRKQAELSRREQPHPTSRSRRTTATRHRGLFGSSLAMGVLSICTTENDPVKYNLNVFNVRLLLLYVCFTQTFLSKLLPFKSIWYFRWVTQTKEKRIEKFSMICFDYLFIIKKDNMKNRINYKLYHEKIRLDKMIYIPLWFWSYCVYHHIHHRRIFRKLRFL